VASGSSIVASLIKDLSFFSIQVNLLIAAVGMVAAARPQVKSFLLRPSTQSAVVPYIVVVGVVFELLLTSVLHSNLGRSVLAESAIQARMARRRWRPRTTVRFCRKSQK